MRFEGQTALVTGASSGLGRATARAFAEAGAAVVLNYRSNDKAIAALGDELDALGAEWLAVKADTGDEEARGTTTHDASHPLVWVGDGARDGRGFPLGMVFRERVGTPAGCLVAPPAGCLMFAYLGRIFCNHPTMSFKGLGSIGSRASFSAVSARPRE